MDLSLFHLCHFTLTSKFHHFLGFALQLLRYGGRLTEMKTVQTSHGDTVCKMGMSLSYPLVKEPESYVDPDLNEEYSYDWNTSVLDLKNQFPHWTADDLLNLRRQFEIFDTNKDRLLDFSEFCASLNMVNDASTMEARKEMFNTADKDNYKSINFEEYLQLMYDLKQGTPVPKPLESEDDKDTATGDIICEVARMDTFQQMCYGVF
ncbi:uncharacterized protein si:ch211-122l24.6 isoform X5 [Salmo trutta]|uniref:uncharacterized protein si:ch211-122l24.6 isoform X5 n=1 Tax=Salmo trutta TaxID=8032 RepID=UPI0011327995|nr:uncharacterized protein LOC115169451 isoform X5 [Salmo trutta]